MARIKAMVTMGVGWATLVLTSIAAWGTHVIMSIQAEAWGILIAGAIMFPIGIIHGIGLWFGWFNFLN